MKDEERLGGRQMPDHVIEVYDGRKWPVVRCDSITISPSDTAHKVTQCVLRTPSVHEKRRRASKYTVAVGTTHGHIQVFLKDRDLVLGAYLQCPADEKCLMLIKRPKDASRKLLKTQSLNNLSMSDTQLYRQYDGTALNNPYMVHKVKGKIHSPLHPEQTAAVNYDTQPCVKTSGPPATSRYTKRTQAPHPNTFVPIPELGIYTPDQHVLRNGTYAQHCHNREINNNRKNHSESLDQLDNYRVSLSGTNGNFSSNSSFDESVSSFGFQNKGVLRGFDHGHSGQMNSQNAVYHSCIDLPNSQREHLMDSFSTLNLNRTDHRHIQNSKLANNDEKNVNNYVQPIRNKVTESSKMDPSTRSHSLGDLSTGLTFSLVGQKKNESVLSVGNNSDAETLKSSNSDRHTELGDSSNADISVREVTERLSEPHISGQFSSLNNSAYPMVQAKGSIMNMPSTNANDSYHHIPYQSKHHYRSDELYQQKQQNQPLQHHQQKQNLAPEGYSQPFQQVSSPRVRKDSEDTTSSYKSAFSEVRSSQDMETEQYNNRKIAPPKPAKNSNSISYPLNIISTKSTNNPTTGTQLPVVSQPAIISHPVGHPSRQQSPSKTRRSLPNVPLNETSERIKRFTEMMKARMSLSSSESRNGSVGSNSSKHALSRMSSISSACSQMEDSRKSSFDTASDSEVFIITNNGQYSKGMPDNSQPNMFSTKTEAPTKMFLPQQKIKLQESHKPEGHSFPKQEGSYTDNNRSVGYHSKGDHDVNSVQKGCMNKRYSYGEEFVLSESDQKSNHCSNRNIHDNYIESHEHDVCQNLCVFMTGETPLPPGDRSADSGQTIGTNHSYNGSALDSGYTTNNDGENDSCKSNPHQYHHQNSESQPKQQHHPVQFQQKRSSQTNGQMNFKEHGFKNKRSNLANSQHFGSVQNVSSTQAHRNAKDFHITKGTQMFNSDKCSLVVPPSSKYKDSDGSYLTHDMLANKKTQNGHVIKNEVSRINQRLSQLQTQEMHRSANRKSWDYADMTLSNRNHGFSDNQMKKYGKADERYRSSEVLPSSRGFSEGIYSNMFQNSSIECKQTHHFTNQNWTNNISPHSFKSNNDSVKLNSIKECAPIMSHSYHGDLDPARGSSQQRYSDPSHEHLHKSKNGTAPESTQPRLVNGHWGTEVYKKSSQQQQGEVWPRPVPVSRTNRQARGHTLPGGFSSESDPAFPLLGQDVSLFHMTQKYDMSPLLINLPNGLTLKDVIELGEFTVEFSMAGVPGFSTTPRGKAPQIGTPGSAFTPVKNSLDQNKLHTARLKVMIFSNLWDEVHKYTTLGRALKGDIILEVNSWFCLGADVEYLKKVLESCKGFITLTVARLKESDEKRYKGQTAVERIKGLESEISRLDDLILVRDERIRNLTSSTGSGGMKQQPMGTLSDINGKIPVEGMVIGGDEYVV